MASDERRLAAIVVADVVGYSAMMERDEAGTLSRVFALRTQVFEPAVASGGGHIIKTTGDGVLAEFPSVVNAVEAAVAVQEGIAEWPDIGEPLRLRIGIHLGDVAVRGGDVFGSGVNIAARLEQAAEPGGILISGAVHDQLTGHFDGRFADAGMLTLKNISRPVPGWRWTGGAPQSATNSDLTKPSIAVLPFDNMSGDSQDYLADGIVEDLTTMLSRFHWFRVTARSSTYAIHRESGDAAEAGRRLGARYVLQGSVRRTGDRIRVAAQLIDTSSSLHLWADRFDGVIEDIFDLQDEIVGSIVGAVVPQFVSSFQPARHAEARYAVSSWELAMRGWNLAWRLEGGADPFLRARALFQDALAEDESNTLALCGLAFSYSNPYYQAPFERDVPQAKVAAQQALEIDDRDAFAWCLLGITHLYGTDLDEAERCLKRAVAINPSLALGHGFLALTTCFRPDSQSADRWAKQMEELSPADPLLPIATMARSMARFGEADYAGALAFAEQAVTMAPKLQPARRVQVAALEMLGDHAAAAAAVEELLAMAPVTMKWAREELTPFADPKPWGIYLEALRKAGVPE